MTKKENVPVAFAPKGHLQRYLTGPNTGCWVYGSPTFEDDDKLFVACDGPKEAMYLVWSNEHSAWWKPDQRGYTTVIARAGRYSRAEALKIAGTRDGGWHVRKGNPDEIALPEQDAIDQYADITASQDTAS